MFRITTSLILLLISMASQEARGQTYRFKTINYPGKPVTELADVSQSGKIIGDYFRRNASKEPFTCFVVDGKTFTRIKDPLATGKTECWGTNKAGAIVGDYNGPAGDVGFVYDGSAFTDVAVPGATATDPTAISDAGVIAGSFKDAYGTHGFTLTGTTYSTIDIPGALATFANGANDHGQIVVSAYLSDDLSHAYIFKASKKVEIIFPNSAYGNYAYQINNKGQVAGFYYDAAGVYHGGVYDSAKSAYYVIDKPGAADTGLFGIDDAGRLVGTFQAPPARGSRLLQDPSTPYQGFEAIGHLPK
jgi:uncharacterized membrane protein